MEFNAWALNAFGGHSPAAFAKCLFRTFNVGGRSDPLAFLPDNLVEDGCVSDLILRLKPGTAIAFLPEMVWPTASIDALRSGGQLMPSEGSSDLFRPWLSAREAVNIFQV